MRGKSLLDGGGGLRKTFEKGREKKKNNGREWGRGRVSGSKKSKEGGKGGGEDPQEEKGKQGGPGGREKRGKDLLGEIEGGGGLKGKIDGGQGADTVRKRNPTVRGVRPAYK